MVVSLLLGLVGLRSSFLTRLKFCPGRTKLQRDWIYYLKDCTKYTTSTKSKVSKNVTVPGDDY